MELNKNKRQKTQILELSFKELRMTIKEFFEADFRGFEEIKIYKNNDNTDDNLITHSCYYTENIIEKYGYFEIKQFWVRCEESDFYFVFIV